MDKADTRRTGMTSLLRQQTRNVHIIRAQVIKQSIARPDKCSVEFRLQTAAQMSFQSTH